MQNRMYSNLPTHFNRERRYNTPSHAEKREDGQGKRDNNVHDF